MNMLDRLLTQLAKRGLSVTAGAGPGELLLVGPAAAKTPEVFAALAAFRPELLKRFAGREPVRTVPDPQPEPESERCPEVTATTTATTSTVATATAVTRMPEERCRVCRLTLDPEIVPRLEDPLWCDRGGAATVTDSLGVIHPGSARCPWKPAT